MIGPVTPIVVIEDIDVSIYASVEDAQIDIEPIDVKTGGLVAYDAEGRLLRLETNGFSVTISLAEDESRHAVELENALRNFLKALNEPIGDDPKCDLALSRQCLSQVHVISTREQYQRLLHL